MLDRALVNSIERAIGKQGSATHRQLHRWHESTPDRHSTHCQPESSREIERGLSEEGLRKEDHGWLAPQELVSCDKANGGCNGGWEFNALDYVAKYGLVPESCFPYKAANIPCPYKCVDGKDWTSSHVCKCGAKVFCQGSAAMIKCMQTGPVTAGMWVYQDFMSYRGGIYKWNNQGQRLGGHAIRCLGYSDNPEAYYTCANSWGTAWGEKGFFRIAVGQVGIDTRNPSYCDPI